MTDDLAAILKREFDQADAYYSKLALLQDAAFRYYEAQPFGNEVEGRSQIVLPDVQEAHDYMVESVSRVFESADRIVEFEATCQDDEQAVEDATAAIEYSFHRRQDGERIIYDALSDGLLKKIGVFKTVVETEENVTRETVIADPLQLGMLPDSSEIEDYAENPDGTVTVKLKHSRVEKRFRDYAVPVSEFRFSPMARHEDEADYLCHASERSRSDLVEMGFDPDQVYALPTYSGFDRISLSESRTLDSMVREQSTPALEKVLLCEEYARIDVDGDGIAERVKVFRVENQILIDAATGQPSIETVPEQPFAVFCPFPRPHRLVGYSLADKVMDLQLARSYVARQLFDGMALANMPRPIVDTSVATADTYNDILTPIPGSPIRVKGGIAGVQPYQTGFDASKSLTVMEWITGERESRTGITRLNQGLDADALNKTATGTALMQAMGQQQEEGVAKRFASALGRLFAKKYRLMKAEGEKFQVKVDGQYRTVDPSQWPDDVNVIVRVGLGTGEKTKRIQARMAVIPMMAEGYQQGMVSPQNTFRMIDGLVRDMGIGKGDDFWVDPDSPEGQQIMQQRAQQPDPATLKMQAEQQKAQMKAQTDQAKLAVQAQTSAASIQQKQSAAEMQIHAKQETDALHAMQADDKMHMEAALELNRQHLEAETQRHIANTRMGGRLDA